MISNSSLFEATNVGDLLFIELDDGKILTGLSPYEFDGKNPWVSG